MKLYRTEPERQQLPEDERKFYTSTLADDELLLIASRDELLVVTAAIRESCEALTDAEFTRKFGFSEEQAWQMQERIWDTMPPDLPDIPL